jgi:hypothetical protein
VGEVTDLSTFDVYGIWCNDDTADLGMWCNRAGCDYGCDATDTTSLAELVRLADAHGQDAHPGEAP